MSPELPIVVEMSGRSEDGMVPAGVVMKELLWQRYGLDLLHPEVSRWLEHHAPDVKYATAKDRRASHNSECGRLRVGADGTIQVHLSLEVDDRLREVSCEYLANHVRQPLEPQPENEPLPIKEKVRKIDFIIGHREITRPLTSMF
ncbi:MAG TPA: hypothetical protein VJ302_09860 [Blastocatellia bacterium]|nr:hypothetical protein [Blastocatellia bacterium]